MVINSRGYNYYNSNRYCYYCINYDKYSDNNKRNINIIYEYIYIYYRYIYVLKLFINININFNNIFIIYHLIICLTES